MTVSRISEVSLRRPSWQTIVLVVLGFWLSSSLILDAVVMPVLYTSGMMTEPGFATAGYALFWVFNRVELLCAAVVLTGALFGRYTQTLTVWFGRMEILLAIVLLATALVCTYVLTPQMSSLGLQLNLFAPLPEVPTMMNVLHLGYWLLEGLKWIAGVVLLRACFRSPFTSL